MVKLKVGSFEQYLNQEGKIEFVPSHGNYGGSWRSGVIIGIDRIRGQLLILHSELKTTEWIPLYHGKKQVVRVKPAVGQQTIVIPKDLSVNQLLSPRENRFLKLIERLRDGLEAAKVSIESIDYQGTCGCVRGAVKNPKLCSCLQSHLEEVNGVQKLINEANATLKSKQ